MLDATLNQVIQPVAELGAHNHHQCYCNPRWTVVRTHPQAERWATHNLTTRGYPCYLPTFATRARDRVLRTLWHIVQRPLFPSYLFVAHTPQTSWRPIYETPGVASVLRNGSQLQYAADEAVDALRASEAARAIPPPPDAAWRLGDPCQLAHGPFQRVDAVITELAADYATVALLMFGQLREVSIQLDCLVARD